MSSYGQAVTAHWVISKTEEATRAGYGRPCDTVNINCLNEDAIAEYMTSGDMDKAFPSYELFFRNCSTVVHRLMSVGLGLHESSDLTIRSMMHKLKEQDWSRVLHPFPPTDKENSIRWVELVGNSLDTISLALLRIPSPARRLERKALNQAFALALAAVDAGRRAMVWTPGDVLYFAHELNRHHQPRR